MLGFYTYVQEEREKYFNKVIEATSKYNNVVIYGAGRVAEPVYEKLTSEGIHIKAFVVSDKNINENKFLGKPVIQFEDSEFDKENTIILICVKYKWVNDIILNLKKRGYLNYIIPPKEIDYFAREKSDLVDRAIMEITVRVGCKINCKYCPQKLLIDNYYENKNKIEELTFTNFKICIDKLPQNTVIDFCGFAEPFLNKDAIKMMKYANEKGHELRLYTTLVGLTKEGFDEIKEIPFIYVVLHTPDDKSYADIPMTDEYFELLDMVINYKKKDGNKFVDTANCQGMPHPKVLEHTKGKLRIMSELYDRAGNIKDEQKFEPIDVHGKLYCSRNNDKLNYNVLLPDGKVVLCNFDFGLEHVIGNLLEESYEEIMEGNNMRDIINSMDYEEDKLLCRHCNYAVNL